MTTTLNLNAGVQVRGAVACIRQTGSGADDRVLAGPHLAVAGRRSINLSLRARPWAGPTLNCPLARILHASRALSRGKFHFAARDSRRKHADSRLRNPAPAVASRPCTRT